MWMPPAGRTISSACRSACSLPDISRTSSTPSPDVRSLISSTRLVFDASTWCAPTSFARSIRYRFVWPIAMTRAAAIARHRETAIRPIGPSPKIATVFPGTFAFVTVYTALPRGSCIVASSGGRSGSFRITFVAGILRYSAKAPSRSMPRIDTVLQTCALPVRHMWQRPHATWPSALTYAPLSSPVTSEPSRSIRPANSCPWMSGTLIRACAHASQSKMCTSVPQIDATSTRIRTSAGPGSGIGTDRISVLRGDGFDFTAAFIVPAMRAFPRSCLAWDRGISTWFPSSASALDRVELRCAISDQDEQVLTTAEFLVERRIARVDPQHRRHRELAGRRDGDHVPRPDPSEDVRARLEVPASHQEALRPDRADDQLRLRMRIEQAQEGPLVRVLRDRSPAEDRIDPEQGFLEAQGAGNGCDGRARTEEEECIWFGREQFAKVVREFLARGLFGHLRDLELSRLDQRWFDERLRGLDERDAPFASAVRVLVEVQDFRRPDAEATPKVGEGQFGGRLRRYREHGRMHLDARRDPEDRGAIPRRFRDVPRRPVTAAEQDELRAPVDARLDRAPCILGRRRLGRSVDDLTPLLADARRSQRFHAHWSCGREPPDRERRIAAGERKDRLREGARSGRCNGVRTRRPGLVDNAVGPFQAYAASHARDGVHDESKLPHGVRRPPGRISFFRGPVTDPGIAAPAHDATRGRGQQAVQRRSGAGNTRAQPEGGGATTAARATPR